MLHNFIPCMMVAGSFAMALHYETILVGQSPTGAYPSRFVSKASSEKYSEMCCSSYLPLAVDDPKSKSAISD